MTPPPITFAGQGGASTGHRRAVRKRPAPSTPRRVSGPKGGRAATSGRGATTTRAAAGTARAAATTTRAAATTTRAAATTARAAATTARAAATTARAAAAAASERAPRTARSTGARTGAPGTSARSAARTHRRRLVPRLAPFAPRRTSTRVRPAGPLPARALAYLRALPDHVLLDRIIRGRTWIAMLGVMLVGIVAMQVEELKLGASVGRGLSESASLQSKNQLLRASVSALGDDQRIERLAARMGMVMPVPGDVVFLTPHTAADASRAAGMIQAPNPASFVASLPQASAGTAASATTLGASTALGTSTTPGSTTTGTAGTTAGTTGLATGTPATGGTTSTGTVAPTGTTSPPGATGTSGTTTGTTGTGTTVSGGGASPTGAAAGVPTGATSAGGASYSPVTTGNGN